MRQLPLVALVMLAAIDFLMLAPASTAAQTSTPPADPTPCRTYTVQPGDWVDRIASENGFSVADLLRVNPAIAAPALLIIPGQVILLPEPSDAAPRDAEARAAATGAGEPAALQATGPNGCRTYIVQPGDWVDRIAAEHDLSVQELLRANPAIQAPNFLITPGQTILLPPSAALELTPAATSRPSSPETAARIAADEAVRNAVAATQRRPRLGSLGRAAPRRTVSAHAGGPGVGRKRGATRCSSRRWRRRGAPSSGSSRPGRPRDAGATSGSADSAAGRIPRQPTRSRDRDRATGQLGASGAPSPSRLAGVADPVDAASRNCFRRLARS